MLDEKSVRGDVGDRFKLRALGEDANSGEAILNHFLHSKEDGLTKNLG
jgi:hypothetical protein